MMEHEKGVFFMKKTMSLLLAAAMLLTSSLAYAQETSEVPAPQLAEGEPMEKPEGEMQQGGNPPEKPEGEMQDGNPPQMPEGGFPENAPDGNPPEMPGGGTMGGPFGGGPGGMPGGSMGAPETYDAVYTVDGDAAFTGDLQSTGDDENLIHVEAGTATVTGAALSRISDGSTGGDDASFYGVGAAVLTTGGTAVIADSTIVTDAAGGAGVFAYGDGVAYVSDSVITTRQNTSGGIHVAGGGTLVARNLTVTTEGESAAAIRSDRGSGTMVVDGGSYTSNGVGSPAVYVTADITLHDANLTATGSEALCMEGLNTVRLYDCRLSGDMQDLSQNDNTWTVIVYQSMSGDAEVGKGRFEMVGGTLDSANGGLFYTTNTESEFILSGVDITSASDSEYFLRCTGNANQRGWGSAGSNGAECTFTALSQTMRGDVQWDSVSTLNMYVAEGSTLTGAVVDDESCAGEGGDGACSLNIDSTSAWIVTGDSVLTHLNCAGTIADADGRTVPIVSPDGTMIQPGESGYTITVQSFTAEYDAAGQGAVSSWEEHSSLL